MRQVLGYPIRNWGMAIVLAACFLPLALIGTSPIANASLYVAFVFGYSALLLSRRVVTAGELASMRLAVTRGGDAGVNPQ
jgi:hypothetical protein